MKITMNLLPMKYKCVPRDWFAIYVALLLVVGIAGEYFALKWFFERELNKLKQVDEKILASLKADIQNKEREINVVDEKLGRVQIEGKTIRDTNIQIDFFNQIYQRHFSWYEFFDKLEALTPPNVWIKDIKINGTSPADMEFELSCEASEVFHAPMFLKNLMRHREFQAPKGFNAVSLSQVQLNADQGNEFSLRFRFLPFKKIDAWESTGSPGTPGSTTIKLKVGEKKKIDVYATNIVDEKVKLGEGNVDVELSEPVGVFNKREMEFTATRRGTATLIINTDDKKFFTKLRIEVI